MSSDSPSDGRPAPQARVVAVLTAAGSGNRLGLGYPKALVAVLGRPLVAHAARQLARTELVERLVVTAPGSHLDEVRSAVADADITVPWEVVPGGRTRQESVSIGLAALAAACPGTAPDVVLVHDAARPFAPPALVARIVDAVRQGYSAVIPGYAVTDTMKLVAPALDAAGTGPELVAGTADRTSLRAVQTPQGFTWDLLVRAHAAGEERARSEETAATDDASLVEAVGETVWVVEGDVAALKITTPHDLAVAELLAAQVLAAEDILVGPGPSGLAGPGGPAAP